MINIKRLRTFGLLFGLCGLLMFSTVRSAEAHQLKDNDGISAIFHIVPFDAPLSNEPTKIEFEFGNKTNNFSVNNYDLELAISAGGRRVLTQPVKAPYFGATTLGATTITFPRAEVYTLDLTGTPLSSDQPDFKLQYIVRVEPGHADATTIQRKKPVAAIAISGTVVAVFVIVAAQRIIGGKRYSKNPK